ncbi:MAG: hypothetical protein ACFFBD_16800 [Candidatus Hodarchaeota archaeon]
MIIDGLAILEERSIMPLYFRLFSQDLDRSLQDRVLIELQLFEVNKPGEALFDWQSDKKVYISKQKGFIIIIVAPKVLNIKKLQYLSSRIRNCFAETFTEFPIFYESSYFAEFNEILDNILTEQVLFDYRLQWMLESLDNTLSVRNLRSTSLKILNSIFCPFCGTIGMVTGQNKVTQSEHMLCARCDNQIQ